ncbi:MAG: glycosyltransferase family 2 protein [Candidatus Eremiobacterota bacterium]
MRRITVSVIVPVYNEYLTVEESIKRLFILRQNSSLSGVQVIIVDDCSDDGTDNILDKLSEELPSEDFFQWIFLRHNRNFGKGRAIKTALEKATGEITIIHDGDLEYNPADMFNIIPLFTEEHAEAVFGSRFLPGNCSRNVLFYNRIGNRFLTLLCNLITALKLTDMETCYKAIKTDILKSIPIESNDFCFEAEITIKLAGRGINILEVPVSYIGRGYKEGKKISYKDGIKTLISIIKYGYPVIYNNLYPSHTLSELSYIYEEFVS